MDFVKIKNHGLAVKTVLVNGKQHFIEAGKVATLRPDLANVFITTHPAECKTIQLGGVQRDSQVIVENTVWVANMTGDPDCAKEVTTKYFDNQTKRWKETQIRNPIADEAVVSRKMRGGMEEYMDKGGQLMARNLPSTEYSVDPFQRIEFPKGVGEWLLSRDGRSGKRQSICRSRSPSELDNAIHGWEIAKIEALVKFIDPMCRKVANTAKKLAEVYKGKKAPTKPALELKLFEEKEIWIKRAHFRLANPKYDLPTLFGFEQWYSDSLKPSTESSEESA